MSIALATEASRLRAVERREVREYVQAAGDSAAAGRRRIAGLIERRDERVLPIRLGRLLKMAPRIGNHRVRRLLEEAGVHPGCEIRRVSELSEVQVALLVRELRR